MDGQQGRLGQSLRFRLSLWVSLAIVAVGVLAGVLAFSWALADAHALQDNQLRQTGFLISRLDAVPASPLARERSGDVDFDARVVVRFLRTAEGALAPPPLRPPAFSDQLGDGLHTVAVGAEQWRVFVRTNAKGVRLAVGQQTTARDAAARASALRTLLPLLLLVPVLLVLVGVLVRQMFKPMATLVGELGRRPEHDLGPLGAAGLPSEVTPFVTEINQLLGRIGRAMALQRRFIADAAHELRSPMTAMSLQAERLAATDMPAEARARLQALVAGLRRTRVLLDQLLTLARAQDGAMEPLAPIPFDQVLREVLEDLVPLAEEKEIDLGVIGDLGTPVRARPIDLKLLLKNLVDNAIRYTPRGGRVDISVRQDGQDVVLQVDDTGPGIAPQERERVFDPFYRVLGNGEIGSGLGLAICRTVALGMRARIELGDAAPGRDGLRVLVRFFGASKD